MYKKVILFVAIIIVAGVATTHWYFSDRGRLTTTPEYTDLGRTLSDSDLAGSDLVSTYDPALILRFNSMFRHIGGQKFILYGVADTEQHFFVEETADKKLKSVYWIQYEAYLPDKSYTYDYEDSPLRVTLGDHEFYTDTAVFHNDPDRKRKPGTDGAMARQFLAAKGYSYPDEVVYARLVYLTDNSRQKELMIIFMDDLATYGMNAAELEEGGANASRWPAIERAHLDRISNTMTVLPLQHKE